MTRSVEHRWRGVTGAFVAALLTAGGAGSPDLRAPPPVLSAHIAPRWEHVASFDGSGPIRTSSFEIAASAVQWRVTATCAGGSIAVAVAVADSTSLVDGPCERPAFGFSILTGWHGLDINASGPWKIVVDQQVKTAVNEAPLPGMRDVHAVSSGRFYGIDQIGSGTVTLYRLPDGRQALRFTSFRVTANSELFVWVTGTPAPHTSEAAFHSDHVQLGPLKSTAGSQNYVVPADIGANLLRSVVIWCEPVRTAYAAATLDPK